MKLLNSIHKSTSPLVNPHLHGKRPDRLSLLDYQHTPHRKTVDHNDNDEDPDIKPVIGTLITKILWQRYQSDCGIETMQILRPQDPAPSGRTEREQGSSQKGIDNCHR